MALLVGLNLWAGMGPALAVGTDWALGSTVTMHDQYSGYVGSNLVDGNDTTRAITMSPSNPQWIGVDLGTARQVQTYRIVVGDNSWPNASLQSSPDNSTWTTRATNVTASVGASSGGITGAPVTERYWRLVTTAGYLDVYTLNLYAPDPVTTTTAAPTTTVLATTTTTTAPPPTTTTTTIPPVTFAQVREVEQEMLYGMGLLIFLGSVHVVGSWGRK